MSLPNTGMIVSVDVGDGKDIHPKNKYDVGLRLARWALARDYGLKGIVVSGPIYRDINIEGDKVRIFFDHADSGLVVGTKDGRKPVVEDKDGKLKWFAIAGETKRWVWADAVIDGKTVVVSSPEVRDPVAVRYAYIQNPDGANLYNRDGLPASPFRTGK
jgi:sialate O-acetylesterase